MRDLNTDMAAALQTGLVQPCFMAQLTFKSGTQYVWTGIGNLGFNAQTYTGVGSLAQVGAIAEGIEVKAEGTSVSLSGIDPQLYAACTSDIRLGAPAKIWFAVLSQGVIIGAPYLLFSGLVDKPVVTTGGDSIAVVLALESRMTNLQRARNSRYTAADQHLKYPDDTAFGWVELMNDIALLWGS